MEYERLKRDLGSVGVVTTTPFDSAAEHVKHDKLRENLSRLLDAGIRLYVPCGGAGEIGGLTHEEQVAVVATTADAVGNAGSVFGGVAGSYPDASRQIDRYEAAGADGVMLRPPGQRGTHQDGLREYYRDLVDSTDLGVILYRDDPLATDGMITALADRDNVLAVKYKDDMQSFWRTKETLPTDVFDDLVWICGSRVISRASSFLQRGGTTIMPSLANFLPGAAIAYLEAIRNGDRERANRLHDGLRPYQAFKSGSGEGSSIPGGLDVPALKYGQELAGMYGGPCRKPLRHELAAADKRRAEDYYRRARTILDPVDFET